MAKKKVTKKSVSLYQSNRKEYYRRKNISASLKKYHKKKRKIEKVAHVDAKAARQLLKNKPEKAHKPRKTKEKEKEIVLLNDNRPSFEMHWLIPDLFVNETGYQEGSEIIVNIILQFPDKQIIETNTFYSVDMLTEYLTKLHASAKVNFLKEVARLKKEFGIQLSFLLIKYFISKTKTTYTINIEYNG